MVIALSALNLDANTDARFTKTVEGKTLSVLGNLLQYRVAENGGRRRSVSRWDPKGLSGAELAAIRKRVQDGEKIRF